MTNLRPSLSASVCITVRFTPAQRWFAFATGLVLVLASVPAISAPADAKASSAVGPTATVNPMLKNAPGYHPPADPESMSVAIGRRLNAPAVKAAFHGGTRSLDDLGRAVCWALHHTNRDSLTRLCVTEDEFDRIMWREFPQSRPATGLTVEDAWLLLGNRNTGGISRALQDHAGRHVRFVRWERDEAVATYRNFRLHHRLTLVVLNEQGAEERLDVVRSVAERRGVFKLYSMKD